MPLQEIYICRHGATAWSKSGQHTGLTDLPLLEEGRQQALALKSTLSQQVFSAVYSSPLQRAVETAHLAGYTALQLTPALIEWDYGEYEGKTTADIQKTIPNWNIFDFPVIGGESVEHIQARAHEFLQSLQQHEGKVLLFSSGHISRVLGAVWLGLSARHAKHFALSTASMSILGFERSTPCLKLWNYVPHSI